MVVGGGENARGEKVSGVRKCVSPNHNCPHIFGPYYFWYRWCEKLTVLILWYILCKQSRLANLQHLCCLTKSIVVDFKVSSIQ